MDGDCVIRWRIGQTGVQPFFICVTYPSPMHAR
jgi:hypothetical protein